LDSIGEAPQTSPIFEKKVLVQYQQIDWIDKTVKIGKTTLVGEYRKRYGTKSQRNEKGSFVLHDRLL
jgi:hypothetical protein